MRGFCRIALHATILGLVAGLCASCALDSWRTLRESEATLERCETEHGGAAPECEMARRAVVRDQARYEEAGRRAWGCQAGGPDGDCPSPR